MTRFRALLLLLTACLPGAVAGEVLHIPARDATTSAMSLPQRGQSMAQVQQRFGAPLQRHAAVGGGAPRQPPITRWDYAEFSVVFERQLVIDATPRDAAVIPQRTDGIVIESQPIAGADAR